MPSNRSKNAPKKNSGARGSSSRASKAAQTPERGSVTGDLVGIALAVVAIAMVVSIVAPSSAVITSAVGNGLELAFGAGAILFPLALLVFSATFFVEDGTLVSGRIAAGLTLVVLAVLAMLSLNLPGAESMPESVVCAAVVKGAGGYVGGFIALALLRFLGVIVGNVVLVGLVVTGIVICGFSISDAVSRINSRLALAGELHRARAEAKAQERELAAQAGDATRERAPKGRRGKVEVPQASLFDETGEGETTFIGDRKTSVLRRRGKAAGAEAATAADEPDAPVESSADGTSLFDVDLPWDEPLDDEGEPAQTKLLKGRRKSRGRKAQGEAAPGEASSQTSAGVAEESTDGSKAAVPEFLAGVRGERAHMPAPAPTGDKISRPGDSQADYELPPLSILRKNDATDGSYADDSELAKTAQRLQGTLGEFGLTSRVTGWIAGPSVTTFKISMGEGERVSKIVNLEDDITLSLAAKSVRIFAPIPGTSLVGIEIPNEKPQPVFLSDVLPYAQGGPLECAFGRDSEGKPIVVDLAGLPHLLVAGTTGSGKSVLLNAIIMSMLMRSTPEQVRLIMVDPKRVEFTGYAGLPHLYVPVVTEPRQAASALQWGVTEMERRLKVFEHYKVRDIKTYNGNVDGGKYADMENPPKHMPYFVIVIDELADLMMVAGKDVESSIVRIAQLGRAAGIHLIVATQRPSADVVTGLIRANIDNRVALSVDNALNSRIILDQKGAEQLLGRGDMLVKLRGKKPRRAQGCWVCDEEIEQTVAFVREQVTADYHEDILTAVVPNTPGAPGAEVGKDDDPLVWEAARIVVESQLGSTSGLQRALSVGYARAGRIMDMLEAKGVVGPANGSKPREVLLDKEALEDLKVQEAAYREVE
ncbi:FtsK/SpoIIIE family DNA translocase [Paratractidigestivibacter faecalis]|uniref:FtsK/SpoIIIE family DNA translocase n=1 Tax=Paratractidigestivibacter faecalis TaxID=2292441 RepID=UPI000E3DBE9F|nr:DNA translocase FtsK [Paratractidigestivibacter faecalis]